VTLENPYQFSLEEPRLDANDEDNYQQDQQGDEDDGSDRQC